MTHKYSIIGATCSSCIDAIQNILSEIPEVQSVAGTLNPPKVTLELSSHVELADINKILKTNSKYQLTDEEMLMPVDTIGGDSKTKLSDFIPLFVIFAYILGGSLLLTYVTRGAREMSMMPENSLWSWMPWMNYFMGIWFALFSLFKFFDLKGFAAGYSTYDIIAKKWSVWGYIYPFAELGLGVLYLLGTFLLATNITTLLLMIVGAVGVSIKLAKKSKIQCLCLGTILKVPLTQITLFENGIMAVMALIMILM
jgi:copper chaperone CopZ